MDETTTSETSTTTEAVQETQADSTVEQTPEASPSENSADPKADSASDTPADEDLKWLKSKGIDPSDPKAVAKAYRKAEQEFHKDREEAKQPKLEAQATKAVTNEDDSETQNDLRQLKIQMQVKDFFDDLRDRGFDRDERNQIDAEMAKIIETKPHLANDLQALYAIVRSNRYDDDIKAAEDRGRQKAKASIAKQSKAQAPSGNAQDRSEKPAEDDFLKGFNNPW